MDNNTYELNNGDKNLNVNVNNREDIVLEENNPIKDGSLFLPIQVENYLNVKIILLI